MRKLICPLTFCNSHNAIFMNKHFCYGWISVAIGIILVLKGFTRYQSSEALIGPLGTDLSNQTRC